MVLVSLHKVTIYLPEFIICRLPTILYSYMYTSFVNYVFFLFSEKLNTFKRRLKRTYQRCFKKKEKRCSTKIIMQEILCADFEEIVRKKCSWKLLMAQTNIFVTFVMVLCLTDYFCKLVPHDLSDNSESFLLIFCKRMHTWTYL